MRQKYPPHTGPFHYLWTNACACCDNHGCELCDYGSRGYGEFIGTDEQFTANERSGVWVAPIASTEMTSKQPN